MKIVKLMFMFCCYGNVDVYVMKMAKLPSPMLASVTICNDKIVELIELGGLGYLTLYALRDPQPVKADECVCDVIGAFQIEDQPCRCIQNRLQSTQEYPPTRRCRSPAWNAPGQLPASGMWR